MILDGKILADIVADDLRKRTLGRDIRLAIILVGDDPSSIKYVNAKQRRAADIGIRCDIFRFAETATESEILQTLEKLNGDDTVNGIMVQLPLPGHIDTRTVTRAIAPAKDVDGLNPAGDFVPATVRGIEKILEHYLYGANFDLSGRTAVVVGRSEIVGRPAAKMLLDHNATVTICHSRTKDLAEFTINADILVSATGVTGLIKPGHVKDGAVLIDAGTIGDIDRACWPKASAYTPVPGGVGPMTIVSLLENCVCASDCVSSSGVI